MTRFEFSANKCEHVSFNFKFSFPTYLVAMKTKTYVCFISTKRVHILSLQNMWIFCRAKTCTHFGKNRIYLMGKGKEEHIIQPDENYILTTRTLTLKICFLVSKTLKSSFNLKSDPTSSILFVSRLKL